MQADFIRNASISGAQADFHFVKIERKRNDVGIVDILRSWIDNEITSYIGFRHTGQYV